MQKKRYFVDRRSGWVAVRDYERMDPDTGETQIVKRWHGCLEEYGWNVDPDLIQEARKLCEQLNGTRVLTSEYPTIGE